jgi:hypothetical protein
MQICSPSSRSLPKFQKCPSMPSGRIMIIIIILIIIVTLPGVHQECLQGTPRMLATMRMPLFEERDKT